MEIGVKVKGVKDLSARLAKLHKGLSDMKSFWHGVGLYMVRRTVRECFDREQSPDGAKWAAWSKKYAERLAAMGKRGKHKILTDTGELRRSIVSDPNANGVRVGTNLVYARRHQYGDQRGDGKGIPARPFMGITDADRGEVLRMLNDYVRRRLA